MPRPLRAVLATGLLLVGLGCAGLGDLDLTGEPPPDPNLVGRWEGPGMVVVIEADGNVGISRHTDHTNTDVQAPAQGWTRDGVDVGLGGFTTHYRIDEAPYEKDGRWRMVMEGVPLERVDAPADLGVDAPLPPTVVPTTPEPAPEPVEPPAAQP